MGNHRPTDNPWKWLLVASTSLHARVRSTWLRTSDAPRDTRCARAHLVRAVIRPPDSFRMRSYAGAGRECESATQFAPTGAARACQWGLLRRQSGLDL